MGRSDHTGLEGHLNQRCFVPKVAGSYLRVLAGGATESDLHCQKIALATECIGGESRGEWTGYSPGRDRHLGTWAGWWWWRRIGDISWEVELPELAERLDVDEMEEGAFKDIAWVFGLAVGRWLLPATVRGNPRGRQSLGRQVQLQMHWRRF